MSTQENRWYSAKCTTEGLKLKVGMYMFVRKKEDDKVLVWNGRHYIDTVTKERAKELFTICGLVEDQKKANDDFSWYLHY